MSVIKISDINRIKLDERKLNVNESYNDVLTRLIEQNKFIYVSGHNVEVKDDGNFSIRISKEKV